MNRSSFPVLAAIGALVLSGCSAPAPATLSVFHREATADDTLPAGLDIPADPLMENVRFLADADGARYYGATAEGPAVTCLIRIPHDDQRGTS